MIVGSMASNLARGPNPCLLYRTNPGVTSTTVLGRLDGSFWLRAITSDCENANHRQRPDPDYRMHRSCRPTSVAVPAHSSEFDRHSICSALEIRSPGGCMSHADQPMASADGELRPQLITRPRLSFSESTFRELATALCTKCDLERCRSTFSACTSIA